MTGFHYQRTVGGQFTFATPDRFFDQLCGTNVGVHGSIGLIHAGPRRPVAESSIRFVVPSEQHYS